MKRFLRATLLIVLVALVIYLYIDGIERFYKLHLENEKTKAKIEEIAYENRSLEMEIDALKNDKLYIERVAREELGMIKEGEKIYRFKK